MARRLESALGIVVEFIVLVFSVVHHVDINLVRHSHTGVVSSVRSSARRSAKEGASDAPYLGWKGGLPKNVFGRVALGGYCTAVQTETSPGGRFPWTPYLTPEPNVSTNLQL